MGMFDKDKEMGLILTEFFGEKEEFIVWSAHIAREDFPTKIGMAAQASFSVSRKSDPGQRYTVTTLARAITDKVREADDSDFPAVVYWTMVHSKNWNKDVAALQFLSPWGTRPDPETGEADAPSQARRVDPETGEEIPF